MNIRNMNKSLFRKILFFLAVSFAIASCTTTVDWDKELESIRLNQALIIPAGQTEITFGDVLNHVDTSEFIEHGTGNDIFLSITDSADWDFQPVKILGNVSAVKDSVLLSGLTVNDGYLEFSMPYEYHLGINKDITKHRIDTAVVNNAVMDLAVKVTGLAINPPDVSITLNFPKTSMTFESGEPFSTTFIPSSFGAVHEKSIGSFKYYAVGGAQTLPVTVNFKIKVGNSVVNNDSKIYFESKFKSMNHRVSYGYYTPDATLLEAILGFMQQIDATEVVDFVTDFGSFKLAEPEVDFKVTNYMGVKVNLIFKNMYAYRKYDSTFDTIFATFNGAKSVAEIIQPIPRYLDNPAVTSFVMNHQPDKGNLDAFFDKEKLPNHFKFELDIENARTPEESHIIPDFLTNRHRLQVKNTLRFPLKFNMNSWVDVKDTIADIKIDSILDQDYIEQAQLVFKIINKMPINCKLTADFLDENNVKLPLDLLTSGELKAPVVDGEGNVVANQTFEPNMSYITVEKSQLDDLKKVKKIALNLYMNNADGKRINFQRNNSVIVNLGVFVKANYNLKLKK